MLPYMDPLGLSVITGHFCGKTYYQWGYNYTGKWPKDAKSLRVKTLVSCENTQKLQEIADCHGCSSNFIPVEKSGLKMV